MDKMFQGFILGIVLASLIGAMMTWVNRQKRV